MRALEEVPARRAWYVAGTSDDLGARPLARTVLGLPVVLFRGADGGVAALVDRCPHRNVPLSLGRVEGTTLRCAYHGWRFDGCGTCVEVPGSPPTADAVLQRAALRAVALPVVERDGAVWVWPGAGEPAGEPPSLGPVGRPGYTTVRRTAVVAGSLRAVIENALDVPHTAFLHRGLFRGRREPVAVRAVVRRGVDRVEAVYLGEPRPPGLVARLLAPAGGEVAHVDRFVLPSIAQVEYRLGEHHLVVTSACTPVGEAETALHATVTFRLPVPAWAARAVATPVAAAILAQDARILAAQSANVARFGGEQFASTPLDVLGPHVARMLRRLERGDPPPPDTAVEEDPPVTLLV